VDFLGRTWAVRRSVATGTHRPWPAQTPETAEGARAARIGLRSAPSAHLLEGW